MAYPKRAACSKGHLFDEANTYRPAPGKRACRTCHAERQRQRPSARTPERNRALGRAYRARVRQGVLDAYGHACACCGETRAEFLALDHVNGGGTKLRKEVAFNTSGGMYRYVRDLGYPQDDYQLLCHNCNCARGWYGACPHERERGE